MKKNNKRRFSFCYFLLWLIFTLSLTLSQAAIWAYSTPKAEKNIPAVIENVVPDTVQLLLQKTLDSFGDNDGQNEQIDQNQWEQSFL